jgi:uncharacterized protein
MTLAEKHQKLRDIIAECGSAVVCFSGGVDSTFLLRVAHDVLGDRCIALIAVSPTMAKSEQRAARELATTIGVRCEVQESHELLREEFKNNPKDRCYYCKSELLTIAVPVAKRLGVQSVLVGTNVDDLGDYRPGMQATKDHGARHPLLDAGLNKQEIHNEVARIELEPEAMPRALELREAIVKLGKSLGFTFVSVDLAGFTSGSLNQLIGIRPSAKSAQ